MDQNFQFGGRIGKSYWDSILCYSKLFRLHALLHNAAGAVSSHTGNGLGYCYMIRQDPNFCLLGHVTGLKFCLYVKIFVTSILNSVGFWSSMSCIVVLDIQLANRVIIKWLGVSIDGKVQGYFFRPPKKYKPTRQTLRCTRNLHGDVWNSGRLDYSELSNFLPRA